MGSKVRPVPRLGNRRGRVVSGQGQNRTADTRIFSLNEACRAQPSLTTLSSLQIDPGLVAKLATRPVKCISVSDYNSTISQTGS